VSDALERSLRNRFVAGTIDRMHHLRTDAGWLETQHTSPAARFAVVWHDQVLLTHGDPPSSAWQSAGVLAGFEGLVETSILLGLVAGVPYFALGLRPELATAPEPLTTTGEFKDLRIVGDSLDPEESALLAQAKAMIFWHEHHRFCGGCGHPTTVSEAGYLRTCSNPECRQAEFPRTDPAIITLVSQGERCLLGRQPRWPQGRYSNIAGFVEPGESLEHAVRREVWEEAGVEVCRVEYHSSQPWPFPTALMIGFTAEACSTAISLNDGELEDARWFTREQIRAGLLEGTLRLPSAISISFHLIEDWFDSAAEEPLGAILDRVPGSRKW